MNILTICVTGTIVAASVTLGPQTTTTAPKKHVVVTRAKAIELFKANCQLCHGPEGAGAAVMPGLNFAGRGTWKHGSTQADVIKTISNGVPETPMQPFKDKFSPEEIAALASLVRSYDKTPKPKK